MKNRPFDETASERNSGYRRFDWQERGLETVSGVFSSPDDMENVLSELEQRHLRDNVSILMTETTREHFGNHWTAGRGRREPDRSKAIKNIEESSKVPEGTSTGGLAGGLLGLLIGGLTLTGSVLIPGAGLLVAGPLVGALTGGAVGAAAGGLIGALVGAGIPEHEAKYYEDALQEKGKALVVAHVPADQVDEIRSLFKRSGAESIRVS